MTLFLLCATNRIFSEIYLLWVFWKLISYLLYTQLFFRLSFCRLVSTLEIWCSHHLWRFKHFFFLSLYLSLSLCLIVQFFGSRYLIVFFASDCFNQELNKKCLLRNHVQLLWQISTAVIFMFAPLINNQNSLQADLCRWKQDEMQSARSMHNLHT